MPTYLQQVLTPDRCYLLEALLWLTFRRLPISSVDADGTDIRWSTENGEGEDEGYTVNCLDEYIFDEECELAGIPPDPSWRAAVDETTTLPVDFYDDFLRREDLENALRRNLEDEREQARRFARDKIEWKKQYERATEYPASQIFIALREGSLTAMGKLLPALDLNRALKKLSRDDLTIFDLEPQFIPRDFWTLQGIDFARSVARDEKAHYCHVTLDTAEVLRRFPGEGIPVSGVERIGSSFVVSESTGKTSSQAVRGRPPYRWDAFHLEVSALLQRGSLPKKKEAAIQLLQDWFKNELGVKPSRAAIGEKLTPYYEKFIRNVGQKS